MQGVKIFLKKEQQLLLPVIDSVPVSIKIYYCCNLLNSNANESLW